ncbi:MAG: ribosome biogenesis GTPase Der [Bacillota bacterium]|nr:ribosome biogenesis GTPase Der [Bacillota bacterium]
MSKTTGLPLVAIVGRPNVGKSALFNRLAARRTAIVEATPGVTRDRLYQRCEWGKHDFVLVDTGGIEPESDDPIVEQTRRQADLAMREADVILFVVDGRDGLLPADEEVAERLRRTRKPVLLVVNKAEGLRPEEAAADFYALGLGQPLPVSALHGLGIGDLLDEVVRRFPRMAEGPVDPAVTRVAVVGRPNVGKSSLVNAVLGEERVITSDIPGTTRDAIDTPFTRDGRHYVIIDTAGIRRRSSIKESVERYSVLRAIKAIERSDIVLVVLDATAGVTEQDRRIAGLGHEAGRGTILVVNKWDLVEKDERTMAAFTRRIRAELAFLDYAPLIFVSAVRGKRIPQLIDLVEYVAEQQSRRVQTSHLNEVLSDAVARQEPPSDKGRALKLFYGTQVGVRPPTFVLFVNDPALMHFTYRRYLENRLREAYGFEGTPLILKARARGEGGPKKGEATP